MNPEWTHIKLSTKLVSPWNEIHLPITGDVKTMAIQIANDGGAMVSPDAWCPYHCIHYIEGSMAPPEPEPEEA